MEKQIAAVHEPVCRVDPGNFNAGRSNPRSANLSTLDSRGSRRHAKAAAFDRHGSYRGVSSQPYRLKHDDESKPAFVRFVVDLAAKRSSSLGNASADSNLQIDSSPVSAIASSRFFRILKGLRGCYATPERCYLACHRCAEWRNVPCWSDAIVRPALLAPKHRSDRRYFCVCLKYRRSGGG
jgi:hypothetical protein